MSWELTPNRSWPLVKYVDLRTQPFKTIMGPDLFAYLYREQRMLTIMHGTVPVEKIYLYSNQLTILYREAAVVFSVNISPSQLLKFRIRLPGVPDRISLCLAVSEFVEIRESPPQTQNGSQNQFSSGNSNHSEYVNLSQSSHSQPSSLLFKEAKYSSSFSSTVNSSVDLGSRRSYPGANGYSYQGSCEDIGTSTSEHYSSYIPSSRSSHSPFPPYMQVRLPCNYC
ncbi:hypothetical protein COOONC_11818 [Cooperia oncophora]